MVKNSSEKIRIRFWTEMTERNAGRSKFSACCTVSFVCLHNKVKPAQKKVYKNSKIFKRINYFLITQICMIIFCLIFEGFVCLVDLIVM